ncbi:hypothetical protein [Maribacter sp. IgM3_T14_3]|uniref:hypothetical protein n=1 Tax=Maribacter sp. IgM3_T14_3 TaxID=3415140 RepID=UPI003C6F492C
MKNIAALLVIGSLLISCGEAPEKKNDQNTDSNVKPQSSEPAKAAVSADYSSLLLNYECDMTAAEVAKIFNIPEADIKPIETNLPGRCDFEIQGFGKNALGGTAMRWGMAPFSKANSKKEIQSRLKDKENDENIFGMDIELSETGDCYITITPHVGRVNILNENYDGAFYFEYSQRGIYKRTEEQHAALTEKTIALANYLLKKHRK